MQWLLPCFALLLVSCSHPPVRRAPDALQPGQWHHPHVDSLVAATELPGKQPPEVVPIGHWSNHWLVRMKYGDSYDGAGEADTRDGERSRPDRHVELFYPSTAYGLQHGDKVGWMWFPDLDEGETGNITLYEFDAKDAFLGSAEFLRAVEATDAWFFQYVFRHRLAESTTVGLPALAAVTHTLYRWSDDRLARILIENPLVRADRETLFALAGLPHNDSVAYAAVRDEARKLLGVSEPNR